MPYDDLDTFRPDSNRSYKAPYEARDSHPNPEEALIAKEEAGAVDAEEQTRTELMETLSALRAMQTGEKSLVALNNEPIPPQKLPIYDEDGNRLSEHVAETTEETLSPEPFEDIRKRFDGESDDAFIKRQAEAMRRYSEESHGKRGKQPKRHKDFN